jgi:RNA polymerase sigma-70 factor (ECF subfamily)
MTYVEGIFRQEAGRVLATLIRLLGDFELAEEARQDAFEAALEQWPNSGIPSNPRAWLVRVGHNKAIDHIRRQQLLRDKMFDVHDALGASSVAMLDDDGYDDAAFGDDRLRLIFTCCHPALNIEAQVALTLRAVCGLTTQAIARAFLVGEDSMAQRIVRAQKKIRGAGIPYETPSPVLLDERIDSVLTVIYLVFTEGYAGTSGAELISEDLCIEAIRLARLLDALIPDRASIRALLALILLHDARRAARTTPTGDIVLLEEQDRARWDRAQIDEGLVLVDRVLRVRGPTSGYAIQAAIAALHVRAPSAQATDWRQIVGLYEVLLRLHPSPVIELNHAVAVSMVDGPARALDLLDSLAARGGCGDHHLLSAARGRVLQKLGRGDDALSAYRTALAAAKLEPERRLLTHRISELEHPR